MKQMKYKVEAFIVPAGNDYSNDTNVSKIVTTVNTIKTESKEFSCTEHYNDSFSSEEESIQNLKNTIALEKNIGAKHINIKEKTNTSVISYSSFDISKAKYNDSYNIGTVCYPANVFDNVQKLAPIDEKSEELEEKLSDLCYHGCKNGCSAIVPSPQEVSEEVFKGNWFQKLEDIKQKETLLRNKEQTLRNRERVLFRKEREIRNMERHLKNKLKQLDMQLKANRCSKGSMNAQTSQKNTLEPLINVDSKEMHNEQFCVNIASTEKLDNIEVNKLNLYPQNERLDKQDKASIWSSSGSSDNNSSDGKRSKQKLNQKSTTTLKSSSSKLTSDSNKRRRPHKIYYEDLDTTLSADIGDSSFVQTSQKFNPELYKKPYAFTRSASERRIRCTNGGNNMNVEVQNLGSLKEEYEPSSGIEEDRVMQRVAKNISASKDKSTKFQHYGLIDQNVDTNKDCGIESEEKYSYLNLETGSKLRSHQKLIKGLKDRPMSWNEDTDEWLQKKRKAYNMNVKKTVTEDVENKENLKCGANTNKSEKVAKKKDIRNKIFTIFR